MSVVSFNLDPRSVALSTEMGVLFESSELAAALGETFDQIVASAAYCVELKALSPDYYGSRQYTLEWTAKEDGEEVRFHRELATGGWQRFATGVL